MPPKMKAPQMRSVVPSKKYVTQEIKKFMEKVDWPPWFRGVSVFQKAAADQLLSKIRDDTEQGTAHRVRACLANIGVSPLVSDRKIKIAMRLSGGNDMAFLWFLMELYYKGFCSKCTHTYSGYSVNEQLILSLIAHLDMVTTLRTLDRILPPGVPLEVDSDSRAPTTTTTMDVYGEEKKRKVKKREYVLPYFEKLRRPVAFVHARKSAAPRQEFPFYQQYMNPNHIVQNEANRWYSEYILSKTKRAAVSIINQVISDIFLEDYRAKLVGPAICATCNVNSTEGQGYKDERLKRNLEALHACMDRYDTEKIRKKNALSRNQWPATKDCDCVDDLMPKISKCPGMDETFFEKYFEKYDYGHGEGVEITYSDHFFTAPGAHKPHKFNYTRILNARPINDPIQKMIDEELRIECGVEGRPPDRVDLDASTKKCFRQFWSNIVRKRNEDDAKDFEEFWKEEQKKWKSPIGYKEGYYDPNDDALMDKMLYDGLKFMRKYPRFVLASLPDAHKTPVLHEWIRWRYGKVYTRKDRQEDVVVSEKIFKMIKQTGMNVRVPSITDLGTKRVISFKCRDYLKDKKKEIIDAYYHEFKMTHLEEVRILWAAIAPYRSRKGSPIATFYAYLPSCAGEILLYKPWRLGEGVDAAAQWKRRKDHVVTCGIV